MSGKHISWLAIALAVVIGAVVLVTPREIDRVETDSSGAFLAGLAGRVNDASDLAVTVAGDQAVVHLRRSDDHWVIEELGGYPADWNKVRAVLAGLAETTVIEPKTGNPEYYARLGVEDVDDAAAAGTLLTIRFSNGEPVGVILGNEAAGREGRYLRPLGGAASVLADFDAEVPRTPAGWANTSVVDLAAGNVAEVRITQPDGEVLRVWKHSADDTDFILDGGLPEGRDLQSTWAMNSLGGVLAGLRFEGVRPAGEVNWDEATQVEVLTFHGVQVRAELAGNEDGRWVRVSADAPFAGDETDEAGEAADDDHEGGAGVDSEAAETAADRAERINTRTAGWAYRVPEAKANAMDKRLEDLLKPLDDAE